MNGGLILFLKTFNHGRCSRAKCILQIGWFCRMTIGLAIVFALAACAISMPEVPPLGSEGHSLPGKVVWHDLVTPDMSTAKAFYGGLLGWNFEDVTSGYTLARNNGRLLAGIAKLSLSGRPSHWLPLVSVLDIEQVLASTTDAGGKTVLKPFDLPDRGRIAVVKDPQGAAFGLVQSSQGDPADRKADINGWLWNEVWTEDVPGAIDFYRKVAGYVAAEKTVDGNRYRYLEKDGHPRVGLLKKPDPQIGNTWVAYIRVADVDAVVSRAKALGGEVLMAPQADVRKGSVAILADPSGAGFVVQEWEK
jgi:predicted enzyme related to lactoylglutathione lyase